MKNQFTITGVVYNLLPTETYSATFSKRVLVLELHGEKFNNTIPFDFINEMIPLSEGIKEGDFVEVCFKIKGREVIKGTNKVYYSSMEVVNVYKLK